MTQAVKYHIRQSFLFNNLLHLGTNMACSNWHTKSRGKHQVIILIFISKDFLCMILLCFQLLQTFSHMTWNIHFSVTCFCFLSLHHDNCGVIPLLRRKNRDNSALCIREYGHSEKSPKSSLPWTPDMIRALSAALSWANAVRPQNSCLICPTISESRLRKYLHLINLQNQYREENKDERCRGQRFKPDK